MMTIEFPTPVARDYLKLTGYCFIAILTTAKGTPCRLRVMNDLTECLEGERLNWSPYIELTCAYWIEKKEDADRLVAHIEQIHQPLGHDGINAYAETLRDEIVHYADHFGITVTHHNTVIARVNQTVEIIHKRMKQAQADGDLKFFNAAFKEARENGKPVIYGKARAKLRDALIRRAIQGNDALDVGLLDEVFQ